MQKIEIVPSLLSADFAILAEEIVKIEKIGCKRIHLDVMDGHFVPNITIGPVVVQAIRKRTKLILEAHLMIEHSEKFISDFKQAGVNSIIIHQEACPYILNTINQIKTLGIEVGLALRPKTTLDSIEDIVDKIDIILIMTVEPGFGGQAFIPETKEKIITAKRLLEGKGLNIPIEVDGGINTETALQVVQAGATRLVAGNAVFKGDAIKNIKALYKSVGIRESNERRKV